MIPLELIKTVEELHKHVDPAHNYRHIQAVCQSIWDAIDEDNELSGDQREALFLAGLLHEVDDAKLNLSLPGVDKSSIGYPLAAHLLNKYCPETASLALECISLISTRTNHNRSVEEKWKLIPRDADRLQAIGEVGIARCYAYTKAVGMPFFTNQTLRCRSKEELDKAAPPERFANYQGKSASMIDHFLDKLLHIGIPSSDNPFMKREFDKQKQVMIDFILSFGQSGQVNEVDLDKLAEKYC